MKNIAVVSVNRDKYSETFIRSQMQLLPAPVHYFYGGYLPCCYGENKYFQNALPSFVRQSSFLMGLSKLAGRKKLISSIASYCKSEGVSHILAHYGPTGLAMLPVSKKTGIPLHVYFHGYDVYRGAELRKFGIHYRKLFEGASTLFAVSHHMVSRLIEMGAPPEKIIYNPCGADLDIFTFNEASLNAPIFISVGRFDDTKNHALTIRAFAKVAAQCPLASLRIVGEGKNLNTCKSLVTSLQLDKKIHFTGALSHKQVAAEMAKARAFVLHSVTTPDGDKEGAPVSIMEAGASGLPVITTEHTGINDIVVHGKTGLLVPENDMKNMSDMMLRLCEEPNLASEMGAEARKRIEEKFSLKKNVETLIMRFKEF